jgi:tetratricopeptide (TPR) repeat protein
MGMLHAPGLAGKGCVAGSKARRLAKLATFMLAANCESGQMTVEPCGSVVPDYGICSETNPVPEPDACKVKLDCAPAGEFYAIPPGMCRESSGLEREDVEQAADQYAASGANDSAAMWYVILAKDCYATCEYDKMGGFLEKAYASIHNSEAGALKSLDLLAAYMQLGDFELTFRRRYGDAASLLEKAAALARSLGDAESEADSEITLSIAMYCMGRDAESEDAQSRAMLIALIVDRCTPNETADTAIIYSRLAEFSFFKGNLREAGRFSEIFADLWEGPVAEMFYESYWGSKFNGYTNAMFGYCCSGDKCGLERSAKKLDAVLQSGYYIGVGGEERLAGLESMGCLDLLP